MSELRGLVLAGPDPKADKVVRWRRRDLRADCLATIGLWIFAALTFVPAFTALLMKRAVAEKGPHPVSE